ncbi:carbon monoxide dehydrogenase [Mycobacterium sp. PS03-16]|uniref:SRPBCC family protein n=1 Tax=Mycobacterium sp. PS03-16 TaxID=2559611 RepID=UPI0010735ED2|nr:SRPBCC family protein [Mycobacterium sp. PS03-16]TFV55146.1 carbon monoxide dehydrogenase [Mycobacterium sp. PS03-16]
MRLVNEFTVDAPLDAAWSALTDIPAVVGCIPGAELDGRDGDDYRASVTVKVGPVGMTLSGVATVVHRDDTTHEMVVRGQARDRRGNGSAEATVTMTARDAGAQADVTVVTELELGGRVAQFGSGVITQVGNRILAQFVVRLNAMMTGGAPAPAVAAVPQAEPSRRQVSERMTLLVTALAGVALGLAIGRAAQRIR